MKITHEDLTLEEKCTLLGGASTWRTHAIERLGIPAVKMSDGPNGVRGDGDGTHRTAGVVIPAGIALGATWNPELVGALGDLLGTEAVRKGAHVLLAPTVNLQRTPVGGRVFECYSEDPELTARLAVAFVRGVQSHDVAVTVKHFVANDTEVDRMTVDARVDERALRELYLRPFEAAVREAGAHGIMSAYNRLNGPHCADSRWLLTDVLRDEWGFDGFVVSDWFGSHDTVGSVRAGLTVPMPGPRTIYGSNLLEAVERGDVDESELAPLVDEVLALIERTHAAELSSERDELSVDDPAERALCRRAVSEGAVLLRNQGALPIPAGARIAVIGPNAHDTRIMGGGSASLHPLPHRSILDALAQRFPALTHEQGVRIDRLPPPVGSRQLRTPDGEPGLLVEYHNGPRRDGAPIYTNTSGSTMLRFFGSTPPGVDPKLFHLTMSGSFIPEHDGPHDFSAVITGMGRVVVDGTTVLDDPNRKLARGPLFFGQASEERTATIECRAGVPLDVEITCSGIQGFAAVRLGVRVPDPGDLIDRAAAAAAAADVAVVVVGTNDEWETEGEDRSTIALPGEQDELIRRVAAANPRTVVVVNAGAPVAMPWIDDVDAVLLTYFGGHAMGEGVVDVLTGDVDPGGRLPITYPKRLEDTPAWEHYAPVEGRQVYGEGLLVGYRGFQAKGIEPLFPFGHGLSYGPSTWSEFALSGPPTVHTGDPVEVTGTVSADADRATTAVVQVYVAPADPTPLSSPRQLAAWTKLTVPAGESRPVAVAIPGVAFRRWDEASSSWTIDPGDYDVVIAASADDHRATLRVTISG